MLALIFVPGLTRYKWEAVRLRDVQAWRQVQALAQKYWYDISGRVEPIGGGSGEIEVRLLDGELNEVAVGEVGEVCVRGPNVMSGYWKRPAETEEAFRGGWLHTGDLAMRDADGYLYLVGRAKDMIVSGGFNVYPKEVEDVLESHPAVAMSAVIGVPDPKWGEAVTAFVVVKGGAGVSAAELIALVKQKKGPVYAPKAVHLVEALPLTGLNKIDKAALRARFWDQKERQIS